MFAIESFKIRYVTSTENLGTANEPL